MMKNESRDLATYDFEDYNIDDSHKHWRSDYRSEVHKRQVAKVHYFHYTNGLLELMERKSITSMKKQRGWKGSPAFQPAAGSKPTIFNKAGEHLKMY